MRAPTPGLTLAAAATVVVAAVVVTGLAAGSGADAAGGGEQARPVSVPVTDSVLVCPSVGSTAQGAGSVLRASSPGTSGTIELRPLAAAATTAPVATLGPTGGVLTYNPKAGSRPVPMVVHATGARAAGLTAQVATLVPTGVRRALSSTPCTEPTGDVWLVGGSTVGGRLDVVYLTNADAAPAVADVTVYGPAGPLQPAQAQGVTVAAHAQLQLALDALAPGLAVTAVQVHTRSGRVAAALQDASAIGGTAEGFDWVPPSVPPSRALTVTGIPGEATATHRLLLLAPGQDDATVRVRFATADGLLSPEGVNAIDVPAGQLQAIDLEKAAPGLAPPYALVIDADHPVVAGLQTTEGGSHLLPDFSWAAGSPEIVGPAVAAPWVPHTASTTTALQITATGSDEVRVRVTTVGDNGVQVGQHEYTVEPGRTLQVVPGSASLGQGSALVEIPLGARVVVGTYTIQRTGVGSLVTGGPLVQTPVRIVQPPAVADPSVGFPGH
jgi:hypothetical protein